MNTETTVGRRDIELKWEHPKKGKLRIMPISDSPWAPTGFGTNTKNLSCIKSYLQKCEMLLTIFLLKWTLNLQIS